MTLKTASAITQNVKKKNHVHILICNSDSTNTPLLPLENVKI